MARAPVLTETLFAASSLATYVKITRQPSAAKRATTAAPIPREPPVTMTVLGALIS